MVAALLMAGCEQTPIEEQSTIDPTTPIEFWATFEGADASEARTYLDEQARMRWTADDRLTIFKKTTYNREFAFTGKTGANAGGFRQVSVDDDFWFGYDVAYNYAIYPHSADNAFDETDCFFTATMPAEQNYVENSFGQGANTMVAVSESGQLVFKNVGSYLRVMLWGENQTVKKITLSSIAGEALAGEAKIYPSLTDVPTCTMVGTSSSIVLNCADAVEVNTTEDAPVAFWIVLPPVVLAEGYKVVVENANGDTQAFEVNKEKTFKRNVYNTLKRELTMAQVPNNQIRYTATEQIDPPASAFNVAITSNQWDETTGEGVITFDGDVTSIGNRAFSGCKGLTSITIPDSVTTIGNGAFSNCTSLTSITIPDGVTEIGYNAFSGCSSLTSVTIPNGVTKIGFSAFTHCSSLKAFKGKYASSDGRCLVVDGILNSFAPAGLTSYSIPSGVTTISEAFKYCDALISLTIGNDVTEISSKAFQGNKSLKSVTIESGEIGNNAFNNCSSLTSVTIGNKVTSFGGGVFSDCVALTSITISDSVTTIGDEVFRGCSSLKEIKGKYASIDGRCLIIDGVLKAFAPAELTSYTIPDGVGEIRSSVFSGCSSLTSITIPDSVTSIGYRVFWSCTSLMSVYCKSPIPPTGYIEMFYGNAPDRKIYVPASDDDSILKAYQEAAYWSDYASAMEEYVFE